MDQDFSNINYYDHHAETYSDHSVDFKMDKVRDEFLSGIPRGGKILDAGCGPGWDSLYFLEHGFQVEALDASAGMVAIATRNTGISVSKMFFHEMDFENQFDGVWASASLLHVEKESINLIFQKISRSLKISGIFYASYKYGTGTLIDNGRWFTLMTESEISTILNSFPEFSLIRMWKNKDLIKRKNLIWLNILLKKTKIPSL